MAVRLPKPSGPKVAKGSGNQTYTSLASASHGRKSKALVQTSWNQSLNDHKTHMTHMRNGDTQKDHNNYSQTYEETHSHGEVEKHTRRIEETEHAHVHNRMRVYIYTRSPSSVLRLAPINAALSHCPSCTKLHIETCKGQTTVCGRQMNTQTCQTCFVVCLFVFHGLGLMGKSEGKNSEPV